LPILITLVRAAFFAGWLFAFFSDFFAVASRLRAAARFRLDLRQAVDGLTGPVGPVWPVG